MSKSEVSRLCAGLDEQVSAFRERRLDARYEHVRDGGRVVSMAVIGAYGLRADGVREVLAEQNDELLLSTHYVSAESMQALFRPGDPPDPLQLEVPAASSIREAAVATFHHSTGHDPHRVGCRCLARVAS